MNKPRKSLLNLITDWSRKLLILLTEPGESVEDPVDRQNARLVATLFVILLPIGLLEAAVPSLLGIDKPLWRDNDFVILLFGMVLWGIAYLAIRAGHYRWAVGFSVFVASLVILAIVITDDNLEDIGYILIPLLVSSLILPRKVTIMFVVVDLLGMLMLPGLMTELTFDALLAGPISYIAFGSIMILLTARHRNHVEKERQARLRESEERLRSVIGQSVDGLILIEDGAVTEWNQGLERITGVPAIEMIGSPM